MGLSAKSNGPILVIDSGLGGVSILNALQKKLSNESFIYFADYAFLPYGEKTEKEIELRCFDIIKLMQEKMPKAVVLACNSATASAIKSLRKAFPIQFFGTEPGIKPAAQASVKGIAVLATTLTLQSEQFANLLKQYKKQTPVFALPAPELVTLVESGQWDNAEGKALIASVLNKINQDYDTLLLGCTHYTFLREQLQAQLGENVRLIDTNEAIAKHVFEKLLSEKLLSVQSSEEKTQLAIVISSKHTQADNAEIDKSRINLLTRCLSPQFLVHAINTIYY